MNGENTRKQIESDDDGDGVVSHHHHSSQKKQKLTTTVVVEELSSPPPPPPPPPYGSQAYWEERYRKPKEEEMGHEWYYSYEELRPILIPIVFGDVAADVLLMNTNANNKKEDEDEDEDGNDCSDDRNMNGMDETVEDSSSSKIGKINDVAELTTNLDDQIDTSKEQSTSLNPTTTTTTKTSDAKEQVSEIPRESQGRVTGGEAETHDAVDDDNQDEIQEEEDVEEEFEDDDEDDDEDEEVENIGLTRQGPIHVLEVGCGDVPIGPDLLDDAKRLQEAHQLDQSDIASMICCDYSPTVIAQLNQKFGLLMLTDQNNKNLVAKTTNDSDASVATTNTNNGTIHNNNDDDESDYHLSSADPNHPRHQLTSVLRFIVQDARTLASSNDSRSNEQTTSSNKEEEDQDQDNHCYNYRHELDHYSLIVEKGTLDALLSDPKEGRDNCMAVIQACVKVLAWDGKFIIISHANAFTPSGLEWLDTIVCEGLRRCFIINDTYCDWQVDIHGADPYRNHNTSSNNLSAAEQDQDNNKDDDDLPEIDATPAIYVIHKKRRKQPKNDDDKDEQKTNSYSHQQESMEEEEEEEDDNDEMTNMDAGLVATIPLRFHSY